MDVQEGQGVSENIGSESAMRIIWESMGLEWPGACK